MVKVDKRVGRPQPLSKLFARNDIPRPLQEHQEDVNRTAAESEPQPLFAELAGSRVEFEQPKTVKRSWIHGSSTDSSDCEGSGETNLVQRVSK